MVRRICTDMVAGLLATSTLVSTMLATSEAEPIALAIQPITGAASSIDDSPMAFVINSWKSSLLVIISRTREQAILAIADRTSTTLMDFVTASSSGPSTPPSKKVESLPTTVFCISVHSLPSWSTATPKAMNIDGTARLKSAVQPMPPRSYVQSKGVCPNPPILTIAELAPSSKVNGKSDQFGGRGTAMIESGGER